MKKNIPFALFVFCHIMAFSQSSSQVQSYIARYKDIALEQERKYGVPAPITLAQGIVESRAGTSGLTRESNNHFGIKKGTGWNGPTVYRWDTEPSWFRVYRSAAESYEDHSLFLRKYPRYSFLFAKSVYDYRGWANGLLKAGYAGAPNYATALIGYIEAYRLYEINGGQKRSPGRTRTITVRKRIPKKNDTEQTDENMEEVEEVEEMVEADENEISEEQKMIERFFQNFIVELNGVRCTLLYPGETLHNIAVKYDISMTDLMSYNEISNEGDVKEGDIVFLAKKKKKYKGAQDFYRAKSDESLYEISQRYGIRVANLAKMNNKNVFSIVSEGEKIRLK